MSTPEQYGQQLRAALFTQVGGFFSNTQREPGFCSVCTSPVSGDLCTRCADQRHHYGDQLADQVLPLAYVRAHHPKGTHQSQHHVWQYKNPIQPSVTCTEHLQLMILAATYIHGHCIARRASGLWQTVTFVPSKSRPGPEHPVVKLARNVAEYQGVNAQRILLAPGRSIDADKRWPVPDRFEVPCEFRQQVQGRHALVVDDTWVTGGSAQSAALTLKAAGASAVTILCAARWLSYTWSAEQRAVVESEVIPYDALCCPVTGAACPS